MKSVYEECPVLENEEFKIRLLRMEDAKDLLKVYSDRKALPFFNSDNCNGNDFYNSTIEGMTESVKYWCWEYDRKGFVRFSIIDKSKNIVIGTIELFNRVANDYFTHCGLLRLDLRSDYETVKSIKGILAVLLPEAYDLFECDKIATKAIPSATERIQGLKETGFTLCDQKVVGHDGTEYGDYWMITR